MKTVIRIAGLLSMLIGFSALIMPLPLASDEMVAYLIARGIQITFIAVGFYFFYWIPERKLKK